MASKSEGDEGQATQPYVPLSAPSVHDRSAAIRSIEWREAQRWCNFVLHRPQVLPAGSEIINAEMRPEAPPGRAGDDPGRSVWTTSNRAAHRLEVGGRGRKLRVKQFLYDWAPPACDYPSLWMSPTIKPFPIGDDILWIGRNYYNRDGATLHRHRTMIEWSVVEGAFADGEIVDMAMSMMPVDDAAFAACQATSLAELSYQRRYPSDIISVPVGYWRHRREPPTLTQVALAAREVPPALPAREVVPEDYRLDSAFVFGNEHLRELDYVYYLKDSPGTYVRVLAFPAEADQAFQLPPRRDRQACVTQRQTVSGRRVHHAFLRTDIGPHEAVVGIDGLALMILAKPTPWTTASWFRELLERTLPR